MSAKSRKRLIDRYDLYLLDLDGVLYLVDRPIPVAVEAVARLRAERRSIAFVTNNASRRAVDVAELLTGMGVDALPEEVLTSAAATATELCERIPAGSPVLVVGADALREELRSVGLQPVADADEKPVAVVQGYGREVGWTDLAEAAVAIRSGAMWVATNTDRTLPSPRGPLPGNGSLIAALRTALDRGPDLVVGKPAPTLFGTAARRVGAQRPLVVGDRLDTDIEGAVRAGMDSLLVLTGVSGVADLLAAPPSTRPTYVAVDLTGLFDPDAVVRVIPATGAPVADEVGADEANADEAGADEGLASGSDGDGAGEDGWHMAAESGDVVLTGAGTALAALRMLCEASWSGRLGAEGTTIRVRAGSESAGEALRTLGIGE